MARPRKQREKIARRREMYLPDDEWKMIKDSAADLGVSVSHFLLASVSKKKPYMPIQLIHEIGVIAAAIDRLSQQKGDRGHETIAILAELVRTENALTKIADRISTS